ncbi:MAG: hypothetical protein H6816_00815 [Phycisphaerales bacterium]|nr:hypothetical protein [Phycisphaerales bacterium]
MGESVEAHLERYIAARSAQVRTWSHGRLKRRLRPFEHRDDWTQVQGTIWDQRIFGPYEGYRCACGRFDGQEYSGATCPTCGVPAMWKQGRRYRFGHINLIGGITIPHPFFSDAEPLDAIPVVPGIYWESPERIALAEAYEELLHQALILARPEDIQGAYGVVLAHLEKYYEHAPAWDPYESLRIARGMLLVPNPDYVPSVEEHEKMIEPVEEDDGVDWDNIPLAD